MPEAAGPTAAVGSSSAPTHFLTSTRNLAWLYSPPDQQPAFAALCAIESEVAASLRPGIDHHVAHARLQWWRDEAQRVARAQPVHPLTRELVKHYSGGNGGGEPSTPPDILGLIDTAVWDLASATFDTRKELAAYCDRWAAAMFEPLRGLGAAVREIELMANLAREAHAGRLRIPLDELERAGVSPDDLVKTPWSAPLAAVLRGRHTELRVAVSEAVASLGTEAQARSRGLMVWAALAWRMSLRAQNALPGMIAPTRYHAFADAWQAWRAARRATTGTLRLA